MANMRQKGLRDVIKQWHRKAKVAGQKVNPAEKPGFKKKTNVGDPSNK